MKLYDLDKKVYASKALAENYKMDFNVSKMNKIDTQNMLKKVRKLAMEARESSDFHKNQTSPTYMKLVFMEEALVEHYNKLLKKPATRIVVENEEVEKSQVVLAAQDLVDTVQKMLEDIGEMQVKELPALVDGIESEIGVNEAQSYNDQVSAQLDTLSGALKEAFTQLKAARDAITGQGGSFAPAPDTGAAPMDAAAAPMDASAAPAEPAPADAAAAPAEPVPAEAPAEPESNVGREKR